MCTVKRLHPLTSLVLAAALLLAGVPAFAHDHDNDAPASGASGRVPMPVHSIEKGEHCVEPTEVMRRDHMKMILHQRDMTMHQGIRTSKYSLKNCVDCHADTKTNSVLGKDGFCESCHHYAAVKIDCFECHSSMREASAAVATPPSPAGTQNVMPQKTKETAKGKKP
jgi:hypothetical protein